MGRVYNALKRAGAWSDRGHPTGRPNRVSHPRPGKRQRRPEPARAGEYDWAKELGYAAAAAPAAPVEPIVTPAAAVEPASAPADKSIVAAAEPVTPAMPDILAKCGLARISVRTLDPHLAALAGDDALARERYNTLAVRLVNLAAKRKFKIILVTSAGDGEGKTTVAINLAAVLAKQSERKVLLIDGDLRHNSVSRALGIRPAHGWIDLAEGRSQPSDSIVRLDPVGLYVLADWQSESHASTRETGNLQSETGFVNLLTSPRAEALLKELEQGFQFVIIDAPSIGEFAEAQRLASIADGTVLVVRAGRTNYNAVNGALKLVPKERRIGVVLNQSSLQAETSRPARKQYRKRPGYSVR